MSELVILCRGCDDDTIGFYGEADTDGEILAGTFVGGCESLVYIDSEDALRIVNHLIKVFDITLDTTEEDE